ncbi:hypothetical protein Tco_1217716 [Tanacetum coccineum]
MKKFEDYYSEDTIPISINEDTAYPAVIHQRPKRKEDQYDVSREDQYAVLEIHFKSLSLDELRSPNFNLFSDQEYLDEEEAEAMAETMKQYMSKTRTDYGSGVARLKIEEKRSRS